MPELPEVETVMRGLEPVLRGRRFERVEQRRPNLRFPLPERFVARLEGRRVAKLERRAKYILVHIDGGEVLAMHLGMSGRFTISMPGGANGRQLGEFDMAPASDSKHDHIVFHMTGGAVITYNDTRRFGFMDLIGASALAQHALFRDVGIEPLGPDLTPEFLAARAHGRKSDLKAFLMDQRIVAGLGNIYVCEVLHRAGLSPTKAASRIATRTGKATLAAARLVEVIGEVLTEAIAAGGSTLRDYKQTDGALGHFQKDFRVYGREGEACRAKRCAGRIARRVQAGRSTFYCRTCQR